MPTAIVTGSHGLIGSEACRRFAREGFRVVGIDNGARREYFGVEASTNDTGMELHADLPNYYGLCTSILNRPLINDIFETQNIDDTITAVIHCAAQPAHEWAAQHPLDDFEINALGTVNVLEATRRFAPQAAFIFCSSSKVYGDLEWLPLDETATRFAPVWSRGVGEVIDDETLRSLYGASKYAADIMVQEYGRYYGMNTVCFRGNCMTGPAHQGAELYGFLAYLVKCAALDLPYRVIGYGGKQVRDCIHAKDFVEAMWRYYQNPKPGAVYNIGGGPECNTSILEAIAICEELTGRKMKVEFVDQPRKGDHRWAVMDTSKFETDYPGWRVTTTIRGLIEEILERWNAHQQV